MTDTVYLDRVAGMFEEFEEKFDHMSAFKLWWSDIAPTIVEAVGEEQGEWIRETLGWNWFTSPTAKRVVRDQWDDQQRLSGE